MTIKKLVSENQKEITLAIDERFDFSLHQLFRDSYANCDEPNTVFSLDLSNTSYMDSSALGMLLLMRDHAGGDNSQINIINCNDDVKKILTISNFGQLFTIS